MNVYKDYLISKLGMNNDDADLFLSGFEEVIYKKGSFLQKEGDKCNVIRIILEGCARGFVVVNGKEISTNFYFENDHTYDYVNFLLNKKGTLNIKALDTIRAIEMTIEALEFLQSEVIGFHRMSFHMFKMNYIKTENERMNFIIKSPKERYLNLVKNNKHIISRIPQHQIASYIGISPEHLSRIRKEISTS
ncbi:cAMP-binding domain of CRP or a regulatory subunit of cAMP-dependent protein kinases [Lutibacter oricola]|uniref:cAMP-binding domain of CRP or a regulatory subunit of cAMP-dependent protein kinases n=1 Tax=Lutibacter oricola TaxID=762486 RepID=A0A1H2QLM3_9FLAO|nr:Crp/Fnr family transcriptional regulator [Lutibacter oricola]SDW07810.1 cAMP-binding domain of CRP or a regulatory subunit of cAMP-dependent protein kinases [Lutibacter oricola]